MFTRKIHVTMTSAALLALATASFSVMAEDAPESGAAAATTTAAEQATATAGQATAAGEQAAAAAGQAAASADQAASPAAAAAMNGNPAAAAEAASTTQAVEAAPADGQPPIASNGVRGDVLLTMLDQRACNAQDRQKNKLDTATGDGYPTVRSTEEFGTNYKKVGGHAIADASAFCKNDIYQYSPIGVGNHTLTETEAIDWVHHGYLGRPTTHRFNQWKASIPLTTTADSFTLGTAVNAEANIDTHNGGKAPTVGQNQKLQLTTDHPLSARLDGRVPYDVLTIWKDAQGFNYQLMLLRGNTSEQARLCWNVNASIVKRLSCTTWTVPNGWKRGQLLNVVGQYTIDDRTAYGESGLAYFAND